MRLKEIKEGLVKLKIPNVDKPEQGEVFYNPVMEYDRNISVGFCLAIKDVLKKKIKVLDALSATGIRAIRYKKECGIEVWVNDANPKAVKLINKNAKLNKLKIKITNEDANIILRQNKFDFIDIDPFGSPVPFLDSAARSFPKEGFLAVTATDTAPLCGTYPLVCQRRYGIKSFKPDYYNELGIRILISAIMKSFMKYEKVFIPILSCSRLHYFRVYGKIESGVNKINKILKEFGYISHCMKCGWRGSLEKKCPLCGSDTSFCEVFLGDIQNKDFCKKLTGSLMKINFMKEYKFVEKIGEELNIPFYYDTHYIAEKNKKEIRKIDYIINNLKKNGFKASRTHFCPTAIKTNAKYEDFLKSF
ncbi:MAG: tRNA (guanine(10)-N(2))-dimethyltransferase [Candidatus Aenigmarchaeota archaeon]|nr:tRNA (guanine(10)-N(2))-dimethyltransferase [Candidatus Aenigmarchaeota archaeon]